MAIMFDILANGSARLQETRHTQREVLVKAVIMSTPPAPLCSSTRDRDWDESNIGSSRSNGTEA